MKILEFKGKMSLKNKILIASAIVSVLIIASVVALYILNDDVRNWIDVHILRREITEEDIATIELDIDKSEYIFAHDRYISILCNGKLGIYNSYGSKEAELDVQVSDPLYARNNNFLAIAENNGQKVYLFDGTRLLWDNKIDGNVSKINVSKSGIVTIIATGMSYKSVIITYNRNGKELFKTYLASTIAIATDVSVNEKYLAIAEVNMSGALIESRVQIIDMERAIAGDTANSVSFRFNAGSNKMITDIKYQARGQLVCIYNDSIHIIYEDSDSVFYEFTPNTQIADINLRSYVVIAEDISKNLFSAKTDIILKNILTGNGITYSVDSSIKEIVSYEQISAINLGTEIHFVNLNGWLEKKYTSNKEVKDIVLGTSIAGIVYRDRIKVLSL